MKLSILKRFFFAIGIVTTLTIFQNCAVSGLSSEPMRFHKDYTENGLIVGSITFPKEKAKFNGYFIGINGIDSDEKIAKKKSTEIQISPEQIWKVKHKGQIENGLTYLFAIERPVGKYEISNIRLFTNSGIQILQRTDYSGGFSIPFNVEKGVITYIGNITYNEYAKQNDTVVGYKNSYKRDIDEIKKLQPTVDWSKAINDESRKIEYGNNKVER